MECHNLCEVAAKDVNFKCHICEPQNSRESSTEPWNSRESSAGPRAPCLCMEGQSCPKCSGSQPIANQPPCDYTTLEQQLRDIEVSLKNDNKAL